MLLPSFPNSGSTDTSTSHVQEFQLLHILPTLGIVGPFNVRLSGGVKRHISIWRTGLLFRNTEPCTRPSGKTKCILRAGYHHPPGDRGESHLPVLARPQEAVQGSPEVSLPQIIHRASSICEGWKANSEPEYLHIAESSKSKSTTGKFPLRSKLLKHFVQTLSAHKMGILHSLRFALDSPPVLIKSPESTELTRSNFHLSLWKGLIMTGF